MNCKNTAAMILGIVLAAPIWAAPPVATAKTAVAAKPCAESPHAASASAASSQVRCQHGRADDLGDMSQSQQMKLQMQMDRRAKANQTASNIAKKQADTASAVTGNMK